MFIERRAYYDMPPDAIIISESEALNHYRDNISRWKNVREIWPLKYGHSILGCVNLLGTCAVAAYFRGRVRLPSSGHLSYYIMTAGICGFTTLGLQYNCIDHLILLQKECVNCVYLKALGIQLGTYSFCGFISSAFLSMTASSQICSYPLPGLQDWDSIKETIKIYQKFTKRITFSLIAFIIFDTAFTGYIVKKQYESFGILNESLYKRDQKLRQAAEQIRVQDTEQKNLVK